MNQQFNEPTIQNPKTIWAIIATVIITAIIVSGGVWWWQRTVNQRIQNELREQIDNLENQLNQLQRLKQEAGENIYKDWKTYKNEEYEFEIQYPKDWVLTEATKEKIIETGEIISLETPDTEQLIKEYKLIPGYTRNLVISYWSDINNDFARGGSWIGQREYRDLEDYFSDNKYSPKKKAGELIVSEQRAYEVVIGGMASNYGIMIEHSGIYELSFERISQLGLVENQILSTFKFTK